MPIDEDAVVKTLADRMKYDLFMNNFEKISIESLEKISNSGKKLTVINGVQYKSREDARSTLGISYSTLRQRLIADKKENFNI
jgi:hypothetical protein